VAVAVGVALGCVCAFLYPNGLFFRPSASALQWTHQVLLFHALFLVSYLN
jgi:arabinosyltransferase